MLLDLIAQVIELVRSYVTVLTLAGIVGVSLNTWRRWRQDSARWANPPLPAFVPPEAWPSQPQVSALVAAWNEAGNIERHVHSFTQLRYPHKELMLCAGGPDGTYALARRWAGPQVTVLEQQPGEGKQRALQRCLEQATGTTILLVDADCEFSDEAFARLLEPLARGEAQVVTGVSQPRADQRGYPLVQYQWFRDILASYQMPPTVDGVLGRNCALSRSVLEDVGEFKAPVRTGTDYYLSRVLMQRGYTIHAAPYSRIVTEYPETPSAYVRMWQRWNKNLLIHGPRFRMWKDVRSVATAFAVYGLMVLLPLLTPLLGPIALGAGLLLASIALANRIYRQAVGAHLANERVSWKNLLYTPYYMGLDMLAVFLSVYDSLDARHRARW